MGGTILVGVDGSHASRLALAWACEDAAVRGAVVDAVIVCRGAGTGPDEAQAPAETSERSDRAVSPDVAEARQRLEDSVSEAAVAHPGVEIRPLVLRGDPAETLCRRAELADLLVVGARGRGTFAALRLGSVAAKCAHHSPRPVVVVPARDDGAGQGAAARGRIVVGVDLSEGSRDALRWALGEAEARHWSVQAVTVWGRPYTYDADFSWPVDEEVGKHARLHLDEVVDGVAREHRGVEVEPLVVEGDPSQRLFELSEQAALLVVGSRGRGASAALLLGSVATKCARHSPGPVVIVHPVPPPDGDRPAPAPGA